MNCECVETNKAKYVRPANETEMINSRQDIIDILTCCSEANSNLVLLEKRFLNSDFFDLKTGLVGTILQILAQYQVKAAFVIDFTAHESRHFKELVNEANRGNAVNFFSELHAAEKWLTG